MFGSIARFAASSGSVYELRMLARLLVAGSGLWVLACGPDATVEVSPQMPQPIEPTAEATPWSRLAARGENAAWTTLWEAKAPIVKELVVGQVYESQERWSIDTFGDASADLRIRMRSSDREAAFDASCERLRGHDERSSTGGTAVSARVQGADVKVMIPGFFPGEIHVDVSVETTSEEVAARCRQLVLLPEELATLEGWPSRVRSCSVTRVDDLPSSSSTSLRLDEATAMRWVRERGLVERVIGDSRWFEHARQPAPVPALRARWHAADSELWVYVGEEEPSLAAPPAGYGSTE